MIQKSYLLGCLCLLTVATVCAQGLPDGPDRLQGLHVGLNAGVNFIDVRNPYDFPDPQIDHVTRPALSVGVLGGYNFDNVFGIRTGVLYSRLGRQAEETFVRQEQAEDIEKTVDLDYVQIPLLLQLTVKETLTGFYAQAGLVYSLLLNAEVVRNGESQSTDGRFRDAELGAWLEAGPSYAFNEHTYARLGFRGYFGITDLNHQDLDTTGFLVGKSQNVAIGVHLSVNYQLTGGT